MKDSYRVTALMSGSSMDGVDLACCDLEWKGKQWAYNILDAETFPDDPTVWIEHVRKIQKCYNFKSDTPLEAGMSIFIDWYKAFYKING